jgi:hypothetical protein
LIKLFSPLLNGWVNFVKLEVLDKFKFINFEVFVDFLTFLFLFKTFFSSLSLALALASKFNSDDFLSCLFFSLTSSLTFSFSL